MGDGLSCQAVTRHGPRFPEPDETRDFIDFVSTLNFIRSTCLSLSLSLVFGVSDGLFATIFALFSVRFLLRQWIIHNRENILIYC